MRLGRQEDSHEFMCFLMDSLSKGFIKNGADPKNEPMKSLFGFTLRSTVTCFSCKHESHVHDPAMDLNLDINGCDSLEKALALYTKPDILSGRNKYKCEKYNLVHITSTH